MAVARLVEPLGSMPMGVLANRAKLMEQRIRSKPCNPIPILIQANLCPRRSLERRLCRQMYRPLPLDNVRKHRALNDRVEDRLSRQTCRLVLRKHFDTLPIMA